MSISDRDKRDLLNAKMLREHEKRLVGMGSGDCEARGSELLPRPTCILWPEHAVTHRVSALGPRFHNPYDTTVYDMEPLIWERHL